MRVSPLVMFDRLSRCAPLLLLAGGAFLLLASGGVALAAERPYSAADVERWEPAIAKFEAADRESAPPQGAILFVGSSSIVGWNLPASFPDLVTINRGFGGSQLADSVHFADRLIGPHRPRIVVLYAGDNDLHKGKTPETVRDDYLAFVDRVRKLSPEAKIVYVGVKPSLARWAMVDKVRAVNAMIAEIAAGDPRQSFVDVDAPMIGADGRPRGELFKPDGLHLNDTGYALWTKLVRPHLVD